LRKRHFVEVVQIPLIFHGRSKRFVNRVFPCPSHLNPLPLRQIRDYLASKTEHFTRVDQIQFSFHGWLRWLWIMFLLV
jgi:hypothetical protein